MLPVKIHRIRFPYVGPLAVSVWRDPGEARVASGVILATDLHLTHHRDGRVIAERDLGSGVVTVSFVNALVSTAVTPANNPFATFQYHQTGTGVTAATDVQTALVTPTINEARVAGTVTSLQVADGTNHAAILQSQAAITYADPYSITEWGLFDAAGAGTPAVGGNMGDRRTFTAEPVIASDVLTWTWRCTLPSNN